MNQDDLPATAITDHRAPPDALLPGFATGPVVVISGLVALILLLISGQYGYVADEQYFLAAGKFYLDWGYMDQQPLVPLLAAALDAAFPGWLPAFRLPAMAVTVLGIVLTALLTREFGGDRRAQTLAAAAYPLSPWVLLSGHWLTAATLEPAQWMTVLWLLARWVRRYEAGVRRDGLLIWVGVVVGIAIETKFQVIVLCTALLFGALAGPRELLRSSRLWIGISIAFLFAVPTLWWQANNGWPAMEMGMVVAGETKPGSFLPSALVYSGIFVGMLLCVYGLWQLFRCPSLKPFRLFAWTIVVVTVIYCVIGARANYLTGLYGVAFAGAAIGLQRLRLRPNGGRWSWVAWPAFLLSAVFPLYSMPIYPFPVMVAHPELVAFHRQNETGWPELADTTARAYFSLPPEVRERTVIVAESYQLAAAIDVHGRQRGLPRAYSPHRGYWYFGTPPDTADKVLYVGKKPILEEHFGSRTQLDTVRTYLDLDNMAEGNSVLLLEQPKASWSELWQRIRTT